MTGELTFKRVHRGSPELLFACMTEPAHLTHFWGPAGTTTPIDNIVVDLRPGGAFETTMVNDADGGTYTMRAVYAEVSPPERLVWVEGSNVPAVYLSAEAQAGFVTASTAAPPTSPA